MSGPTPAENRRAIISWPSSRLLDHAEANPDDSDLLEFILAELNRRDVDVAQSAARQVSQLLLRSGSSPEERAEPNSIEQDDRIARLEERLEASERRVREAEHRASAAERALAMESLPMRGNGLLRRVHLADTAPIWLVEAVRRAFRLRFHPDRFADPVMKARAEETYKEAEEVFRHIISGSQ